MRPLSRRALVASALVAPFALGCSSRGRSASAKPRLISLSPSTTEALYAIGAGGDVVGRSRFCDYPPEVTKLPAVGGFVDASLEAILGLAPTLVVGARGPGGRQVVDALEARGIATYFPETESIGQIEDMIRGLGQRLGRDVAATTLLTTMQRDRAAITAALAHEPRRSALLLFGLSPIVGAGPLGFPHEMLTLSGCQNVLARGDGRKAAYPTLSLEQVLAADPDVVLVTAAMGEAPRLPSTWDPLRAVKTGSVRFLPGDEVLRPGPRIAKGQRVIAAAVFPHVVLP